MNWLRFAAIWVYCLGTFVVPALHHGLHKLAHANLDAAYVAAQSDDSAACMSGDCGCRADNPFAAKRADRRPPVDNSLSQPTLAASLVSGLDYEAAGHHCSDTCVVCLAISVFGNATAPPVQVALTVGDAACFAIVDQRRTPQTCLGESAPRGPPAASLISLV